MTAWTQARAQALADLACAVRPPSARQWKPDDVMAELAKLRGRSLGSVICATTRCAMDRHAERPSCISSPGSHWGDTMLVTDWVPNTVPREDRCSACSKPRSQCPDSDDDHRFRSAAVAAKEARDGTSEATSAAVAALRDELRATPKRPPATGGLADAPDPVLHARVQRLRATNPGLRSPGLTEPTEPEEAVDG